MSITSENGAVYRTKRTGPRTDPSGTPHQAGIEAELQFGQSQSEFCLNDKKRTSGEEYCICQKRSQDIRGEWCGLLCQRQPIDQAELEQIRFPGQKSVEGSS